MINDGTFAKNYKEVINDFSSWEQREYASKQVLLPENMGEHLGIGETSFCHEVYTILHNKDGHGKKHTIITIVKETKPSNVITVLRQLPEENRLKVSDITIDLSNSMGAIAKAVVNPATLANEETKVEGLTRCKKQMLNRRDK